MSIEFNHTVKIELSAEDMLAMVTDQICGGYGSFKRMEASYISETGTGWFQIELVTKQEVEE